MQAEIEEFARKMQEEKEQLERQLKEENERKEKQVYESAVTIQAAYRSYRYVSRMGYTHYVY